MYIQESQKIAEMIEKKYFLGIQHGDIENLRSIFHPKCLLFGDVSGAEYFRTVDEYIELVKNRKSPEENGEINRMKILSIEILGQVAYVKAHVPMLGKNYYDFLALRRYGDEWKIVNKLFANEDVV